MSARGEILHADAQTYFVFRNGSPVVKEMLPTQSEIGGGIILFSMDFIIAAKLPLITTVPVMTIPQLDETD